jgi:ribosomal protein S18 acetylase RimI-like enzyme
MWLLSQSLWMLLLTVSGWLVCFVATIVVDGFIVGPTTATTSQRDRPYDASHALFAQQQQQKQKSSVNVIAIPDCDEPGIREAAGFVLDSFWIGTPRQWTDPLAPPNFSDSIRSSLVEELAFDLSSRYGERMGKRLLDGCIILAIPSNGSEELWGIVCVETLLLDTTRGYILTTQETEDLLKNAVASLGPTQRRQYKNSSAKKIADELLPATQQLFACFSNLAVSPVARGHGIGLQLCQKVETVAREYGFDELFLKVEKENTVARRLYEQKLGYAVEFDIGAERVIRLDTSQGEFVELDGVGALILKKSI